MLQFHVKKKFDTFIHCFAELFIVIHDVEQ